MQEITFIGSLNSTFSRKLGSKDKKKRKIIDNKPSTEGQIPLSAAGQQNTGYKYYRKRRALAYLAVPTTIGAVAGGITGSSLSSIVNRGAPNKKAALAGAITGGALLGGASLLEHAKSKYSPFYQKKLFGKKDK